MSSTNSYTEFHTDYAVAHAILILVFSFFACLAITLRLWARKIQHLALSLSDYTIILGLIFALGECALNVYECCFPQKWKTVAQNSPKNLMFHLKIVFLVQFVWIIAVTIIRTSIILLYIHIFSTRKFRIVCYAALGFNLVFLLTFILARCLVCKPIAYSWDYTIPGGSCGDEQAFDMFTASVNLLQDFIVVVLPMRVLWRLQMATTRKLAVSGMFSMGLAICAITSYRVYITSTITNPSSPESKKAYSTIALVTSLETLLGIITACLPMSKPVAQRLWNALPKYSRDRISAATTAIGSIIPQKTRTRFLSLLSMGPSSLGFSWSSSNRLSHDSQTRFEDRSVSPEDYGMVEMEKGRVHVHQSIEVKSEAGDISR